MHVRKMVQDIFGTLGNSNIKTMIGLGGIL
jgi:hypothetical protein